MNKKLITVAIGAVLAAAPMLAAAQSTVRAYGRVQVEAANVDVGGTGLAGTNNIRTHAGVTQGKDAGITWDPGMSRFGIVANEDLGGGLTAIARVEFGFVNAPNASNPAAPIAQREAYVGLESKTLGTLRLGRFNSPYQNSGIALDPFVATTLEARGNGGMTGTDGSGVLNGHSSFVSKGMNYASPALAGITANVYLGLDGIGGTTTCGTLQASLVPASCAQGTQTAGDISATLTWTRGPARAFVGYNMLATVAKTATAAPEPTAIKVGGQFKIGTMHTLSAQHEMIDRDAVPTAAGGNKANTTFLGYQLTHNKLVIAAQGGQTKDDRAGTAKGEGSYYALGAIYNFSRTARVFGGYRSTELSNSTATNNTYRDERVVTVGMRKDF